MDAILDMLSRYPLRPVMSDLSSVARRVHAPELGMERARTGSCTGGYEAPQQQWVNKQRMRSAAGRTATVPAVTTVRDLIRTAGEDAETPDDEFVRKSWPCGCELYRRMIRA